MRSLAILATLALTGCTTPSLTQAPDWVAHFNEPFLTFESDGAALVLRSPEEMDGRTIAAERQALPDGATFIGMLDPAAPESRFRLTIRRGYCADDMAGLPFSHAAVLERGAALELRPQTGCARLTTEPQPSE